MNGETGHKLGEIQTNNIQNYIQDETGHKL